LIDSHTITGSTVITLMDQIRAFVWSLPRLARIGGLLAIIGLGLLLLAEAPFSTGADIGSIALWAFAGLFGCAVWLLAIASFYRRLSDAQKQLSYEIDAEQIRVRDSAGSALVFPWEVVRSITETNSGFSLAMRPAGARWLPRRAFTPEAISSLRGLARAKLERNARLMD
jgi:hypothetical protein